MQQNWLKKIFRLKIRPSPNYFNDFWLFSHVFSIGSRWFCIFKLLSTVFIYLLSIWVVKISSASKLSCLQIIFCLQIKNFASHKNIHSWSLLCFLSFKEANYNIRWHIIKHKQHNAYIPTTKQCLLCLNEKLIIEYCRQILDKIG